MGKLERASSTTQDVLGIVSRVIQFYTMNTWHTKSVMRHNPWMIHTITYKGVRDTLGKRGKDRPGENTADPQKYLEIAECLRKFQLVKGMGIRYEPRRQEIREVGRI